VHELIQQHNVRVRQQKEEVVFAQIARGIESLQNTNRIVKVEEIAKQAGLSYVQLRDHYPELRLKIHGAIQEHRTRLKQIQIKNQIQQIDIAATQLINKGRHLNYQIILREAGLSRYAYHSAPIRDALARWVSNFAPRD
jgi:hypothetical protein